MSKRTREEQNVEPIAEENHYRAKKRRLAYGNVASATCVRDLFATRNPPSIKEERKVAIKNKIPQKYDYDSLKKLGEKARDLFHDD